MNLLPGFLEEDEPAERDERELQPPHEGDHPPHRHRQDAHRLAERPTPMLQEEEQSIHLFRIQIQSMDFFSIGFQL